MPWNENVKNEIERKTQYFSIYYAAFRWMRNEKNERKKMKDQDFKKLHWWYRLGLSEQITDNHRSHQIRFVM
jgi:hypothetical protein